MLSKLLYDAFNKFVLFSFSSCLSQKYSFIAEDLQDKGHLGEGAFGTVSKMVFNKTKTLMAVKVNTQAHMALEV